MDVEENGIDDRSRCHAFHTTHHDPIDSCPSYPTRAHQFMRDAGESLALPFLPVSPLSPSLITPYPPIHVQMCNTTQ
jgi:hypothetical protein